MRALSVSTVCLRQYPLPDALRVARELGFTTVDLVGLRGLCEHVPVNGTTREMMDAARHVRASGLAIASVNADPGSFDGVDDPADVAARVNRTLGFCEEAGVELLVLPCGEKTEDPHARPAYERMAEELDRVAAKAEARGIRLAVEAPYFGRPVDTAQRTAAFAERLSESIALAFDVSHIEAAGESVVDAWQRFSDRVAIVHLRDAVPGDIRRVIGRGRVDFGAFFRAAAVSGYVGEFVLELETRNSPFATKEAEVAAAVADLQHLRTGNAD